MFGFLLLTAALTAQGNGMPPASGPDLINLKTPQVLGAGQQAASVDLRLEGGYEKTLRADLGYRFGLGHNFEVDGATSLTRWDTETAASGSTVRSGGTDGEVSLKYKVDAGVPVSVQAGLAYVQTPAQQDRLETTLGASAEWEPTKGVRLYANPRAVFLDNNSIFGFGLGFSAKIVQGIDLLGDWTPILSGDNTVDMQTGQRDRGELYSIGLSFNDLIPKGAVDLGITNATGSTTGSSLTPTLGGAPSLFLRLSYRF